MAQGSNIRHILGEKMLRWIVDRKGLSTLPAGGLKHGRGELRQDRTDMSDTNA